MIPVAPFTNVNIVADASHIRLRDFLLGTILEMGPGIFALSLFTHQPENTAHDPALDSLTLRAGLGIAIVLAVLWRYRRLSQT